MTNVSGIEGVPLTQHGFMNKLLMKFDVLDGLIGNVHFPYYDPIGAPQFHREGTDYFVYTFGASGSESGAGHAGAESEIKPLTFNVDMDGKAGDIALQADGTFEAQSTSAHGFLLKTPIGSPAPGTEVEVLGSYRAAGDRVFLGVSGDDGKNVWNTLLPVTDTSRPIPISPILNFVPGRHYVSFVWSPPGNARFTLEHADGVRLSTIRLAPQPRPQRSAR